MKILVTGGAGYIGSHMVFDLMSQGHEVCVIDNLTTGQRSSVPASVKFFKADAGDRRAIAEILRAEQVEVVFHFAASASVPESMVYPIRYFTNNFTVTKNLVEACLEAEVRKFVFSSTAAVYGEASSSPITEDAPTLPINPYGESKLICENFLRWVSKLSGGRFNSAVLRYFNVAGASPCGELGQSTKGAQHLIKIACEHVLGLRSHIEIFGNDYDTHDGTCIRDYIHVMDLISAHNFALDSLNNENSPFEIFNCGYGKGSSVREVLNAFAAISDKRLIVREGGRRAGDPEELVACSAKLKSLGWQPKYDDLKIICSSALSWEQKLQSAPSAENNDSNSPKENYYIQ